MSSGAWGRFWRQLLQAWCWCTCDVMRPGFPPCGQKSWKHSGQPWPPPYVRLNVYSNQNAYTPVMFGEQIQHVHFVLMPRGSEVPVEHRAACVYGCTSLTCASQNVCLTMASVT